MRSLVKSKYIDRENPAPPRPRPKFQFRLRSLILLFIPSALLAYFIKNLGIELFRAVVLATIIVLGFAVAYLLLFVAIALLLLNTPNRMAAFWDRWDKRKKPQPHEDTWRGRD